MDKKYLYTDKLVGISISFLPFYDRKNRNSSSSSEYVERFNTKKPLSLLTDCDSAKIRQVIFNLLDNAVRFTFEGKIVVTTQLVSIIDYFNNANSTSNESKRIDTVQGKHYKSIGNSKMVIISIQNEGEGVNPGIKDQMFEKFATKSAQGTGLGLYLSKKIVEAHGGIIWMEEYDNLNIILDKKENIGDNRNSSDSSSYPDIKKRKKSLFLNLLFRFLATIKGPTQICNRINDSMFYRRYAQSNYRILIKTNKRVK